MTPTYTTSIPSSGLTRLLARTQRLRLASMTFGAMLGMAAVTYVPQVAHAQSAATAAPAAKPTPARAAAQATAKRAKAPTKKRVAVAKKIAAPQLVPLPDATPEQLAAASRVLIGRYECEFSKHILVDRNDKNPGYINLTLGKQSWVTKPVLSSTGAIRLEDSRDEILLLQILTKSMVMNIKTGQRIVDGCVHEVQRLAEQELGKQPRAASFFAPPPEAAASATPAVPAASRP